MRLLIVLAAVATSASFLSVPAEAREQRKPLRVKVEGRSFLDAGKVVPVGQYNRHLDVANSGGSFLHTGNISNIGRENLPDRFAGANPFANSFYGPSLR
ncbi:MAG: hypothetical protein ACRCUE_01190 [Bosea sp. (in: a-proteobacteria)]